MTEVERTGLSTLIQSKKEKWRSIRASRKRKLHEVYCVATQVDALPLVASVADDSQPATAEESKFHDDNVILQGPFLNERNLPPRRIPPPDIPQPHNSVVAPAPTDASPVCSQQTQDAGLKPAPAPHGPPLPQPGEPVETRDGSFESLSGAPTAASPPPAVAPLQNGHDDLQSGLDAAPSADRELPDRLSQPGPPNNAEDVVALERSQGLAGREVAFVEPEKQPAAFEHANSVARHATEGQDGAEGGQQAAGPDAMDLDETSNRRGEAPRLTSLKPPPLDAARPPDILSSPGSTAQTATTPAVHEASPDTSPDNEGPRYPGDDDDLEHQVTGKEITGKPEAILGEDGSASGAGDPGASQAAAAQLLAESADARLSTKSNTMQSPVDQGSGAHLSAQATTTTHPATEEATAGIQPSLENPMVRSRPIVESPRENHQRQATPAAQVVPSVGNEANLGTASPVASADQQTPGPSTSIPASFGDAVTQSPAQQSPAADIDHPTPDRGADASTRLSGLQQQDGVVDSQLRKRSLAEKHGLKHKRVPTVVFEKAPKKQDETIVASQSQGRYRIPTDDYFVPLFFDGFTRQSNWMKSPEQLLGNTHKTLSSGDCSIVLQENQACKVLRRIYHLQQNDKWSLRQPKRCPEPTRPPSHWDLLLQEMKWMRTDFREERKWKRAAARNLAEACAEWVASGEEERKILQVNAKIPPLVDVTSSSKNAAEADSLPTPMPDLVPSGDADSPSPMDIDEEPQDWRPTIAPSAIFALQDDEIVFGLQRSAASDRLLDELPLYGEPLKAPQPDLVVPEYDPDARWRRPAIPLSKYVEGEMLLKPARPRLQQSRFKYAVEDEEDDFEVAGAQERDERTKLPPENTDVALFRPDMKMIRDRLHAGVKFRPPTESLMPLQTFYENRIASAWTSEQDDELRKEVREHSYNWSLISQIISSKTLFVSAEDRRTPWECFERWVQLEGFPNDAARTQYFQTYQRRIDSAQRTIAQANENARPQVGPNGAVTPAQRRRSTLPYRVERKTSKRHFAIIDAMKKLAKKREAAVAKQQQTANNQNRRTSNDNAQQKLPTKTPEDYSRLRHEREKQMQEKLMRFTQQQEAQRQAALQGRASNQMGRVPATPGAAQAAQNAAAAHAGMANPLAARLAGQVQAPGQARPRLPMQQQQAALAAQMAAGGLVSQMPVNMSGMTQAQQLAVLQAGQRMQMPDANLVMQARRIQDQQRRQQAAQQQAQGQIQGHHHPQQQQQVPPQQQAQQMPPQHSPPQVQAQPAPQNHQNHPMPNGPAPQANSPAVRNGMNGVNQNNFMMNNMTGYTPNGMGMATSPSGVGMNMHNGPAGSPPAPFTQQPRGLPASMQAHFAEFENQIRMQNPDQTPAAIRQTALVRYQQLLSRATMQQAKNNVVQNAMDAAAGSPAQQQAQANGIANASSPQQYAQLLRQQQLQQQGQQHTPQQVAQHQQQQAIAQAAAARQVNQQQHQRQPSGGTTPVPGR